MTLGLTRLARLLLVALTLLAATAGAASANGGGDASRLSCSSSASRSSRPSTQFQGTAFGGLSSFAYDNRRHVFYALSDDQVGCALLHAADRGLGGGRPRSRSSP